jgi:nicotinamidase-related amidase
MRFAFKKQPQVPTDTALVVIDMQSHFLARDGEGDNDPVVAKVVKRIEAAKQNGDPIISVRFDMAGNLCPAVEGALKGYGKVVHVIKDENDGSEQINKAVRANGVQTCQLVLVGVNLEYCVRETCNGLRKLGYQARVEREACNAFGEHYMTAELYQMNGPSSPDKGHLDQVTEVA